MKCLRGILDIISDPVYILLSLCAGDLYFFMPYNFINHLSRRKAGIEEKIVLLPLNFKLLALILPLIIIDTSQILKIIR